MKIYIYLLVLGQTFNYQFIYGQNIEKNNEYIEFDSVLINGTLSFKSDTANLYIALGKPNFIEVPDYDNICATYFEKGFKYLHYNGSEFEVYRGKVVCRSLNFKNNHNLDLKTPVLILNGKTSITELKNYFPVAVSKIREINLAGLGIVLSIGIPTSKNITDDEWILFFKEGILIRIDYWIPC